MRKLISALMRSWKGDDMANNTYDQLKKLVDKEMQRQMLMPIQSIGIGGGGSTAIEQRQRIRQAMQDMPAMSPGPYTYADPHPTRPYGNGEIWKELKRRLLFMRLEIPEGQKIPFEFLEFMKGKDCVYVMVARTEEDKPIVIEDDVSLFPSDTLVTQLRLMIG